MLIINAAEKMQENLIAANPILFTFLFPAEILHVSSPFYIIQLILFRIGKEIHCCDQEFSSRRYNNGCR